MTYRPLLALPGLGLLPDLSSRQPIPEASSDRHRWSWPCLPRFRLLQTHCYCGALGGFPVLVGSLPSPSSGRLFVPSCLGRLLCHEAGLTYRPLLALLGLGLISAYLTCSQANRLLRLLAMDIGGVGPVFLALDCFRPLAFAICWVVFLSWLVP